MGSPSEVNPPGYNIQQHSDSVKDVSKEETAEVCQDRAGSRWEPGFFRRFPYLGFAALLLCIGCTGAAVGIISLTHEAPIEEWEGRLKPQVLLSYTTTIANSLMGFAFAEAAVIGFWNNALDAMPASNLHYYWAGSSSAMGAVRSIFHRRAVLASTVCILVTASSLLRGPLIQRASIIERVFIIFEDTFTLPIMPNTTDGWAGRTNPRTNSTSRFSPGFATVVNDFQYQNPILIDEYCTNCTMNVTAFGFAERNCSTTKTPYNLTIEEVTKSLEMFVLGVFTSGVSIVTDDELDMKAFHISVSRKTDYGLTGEIEHHSCFLYPAAVNYTLSLDSGILSFKYPERSNDTVVELLKLDQLKIFDTINAAFFGAESTATFSSNDGEWAMTSGGLMANMYYQTELVDSLTEEPEHVRFDDPMDDIINSFREIALRMSVREAVEKNIAEETEDGDPILVSPLVVFQNITYESNITVVRYTTDDEALALGVVVSLVGPLATLVLFWGFWRLGRRVTMSPLEMINALSAFSDSAAQNGATDVARIFADCKSNVEGAGVANYVRKADSNGKGEPKLQYGVVEETGRLGMVVVDEMHPEERRVRRPMKGEVL